MRRALGGGRNPLLGRGSSLAKQRVLVPHTISKNPPVECTCSALQWTQSQSKMAIHTQSYSPPPSRKRSEQVLGMQHTFRNSRLQLGNINSRFHGGSFSGQSFRFASTSAFTDANTDEELDQLSSAENNLFSDPHTDTEAVGDLFSEDPVSMLQEAGDAVTSAAGAVDVLSLDWYNPSHFAMQV